MEVVSILVPEDDSLIDSGVLKLVWDYGIGVGSSFGRNGWEEV